jgi:hypothetical protein
MAGLTGAIDVSVAISEWLGKAPRIDTSWRHIDRWSKTITRHSHDSSLSSADKNRILFFAIYPHWIDYSMAIAALLCGRGVSVDFRWLGEMTPLDRYPRPVREAFWKRQAAKTGTDRAFGALSLKSLDSALLAPVNEGMRRAAEYQSQIDVSYLLKKERVDVEHNAADKAAYEERLHRNLRAIQLVAAAYDSGRYSRLLLGNGGVLEFGAIYRYFQSINIPVTTFESVDIRNRIWIAHHESVVRADTTELWKSDEPHTVTPERRKRIEKIMHKRQTPGSGTFVIPYQKTHPASAETVRAQLGLDVQRPTILICPNVPFDAVFYSGGRQVFSGMWEWLVETCRVLAQRNDCQVVVRCHPAEPYFDTHETARALLNEYVSNLPPHVHIIAPTDLISTYSLMEIAAVGVVFASTTGLEMAMRGIPVVCGNAVQHYNRKGFTIDADSREQFFGEIDRIIKDPAAGRLTDRQVELAQCYADLYFNKWYRRFPWQAQSLWSDLKVWPMDRILSDEGEKEFGPVLDELVYGRSTAAKPVYA